MVDVFSDPSLPKAFYHPSRKKSVKSKVTLSPERLKKPKGTDGDNLADVNWDVETADSSSHFDESWPSEKPTLLSATEIERTPAPTRFNGKSRGRKSEEADLKGRSTLSKYIDRFRYDPPTDKDARAPGREDFWWMKDENISTSKDRTKSALTMRHVAELSQKTDRILERTEDSLRSIDPIVSTEGLGSTLSSEHTVYSTEYKEPLYRPRFTQALSMPLKAVLHPSQPDDDILVQWRRRRKLEEMKAKNAGQPTTLSSPSKVDRYSTSWTADENLQTKLVAFRQRLQGLTASDDPVLDKATHPAPVNTKMPTPTATPIKDLPIASSCLNQSIIPHYHFSCDIMPCPIHTNQSPDDSFELLKAKHMQQLRKEYSGKLPDWSPNVPPAPQLSPGVHCGKEENGTEETYYKRLHERDDEPDDKQVAQSSIKSTVNRRKETRRRDKFEGEQAAAQVQRRLMQNRKMVEQESQSIQSQRDRRQEDKKERMRHDKSQGTSAELTCKGGNTKTVCFGNESSTIDLEIKVKHTEGGSERIGKHEEPVSERKPKHEEPVCERKAKHEEPVSERKAKHEEPVIEKKVRHEEPVSERKIKTNRVQNRKTRQQEENKQQQHHDIQTGKVEPLMRGSTTVVDTAISQVVSDRLLGSSLFDGSLEVTNTAQCDADSSFTTQELESALCSDEEDFKDDEVLQSLRKQRKVYLGKLREIEEHFLTVKH